MGREAELAAVREATVDGVGAVVFGPSGVGKTALAAAVADDVERSGDRVERVVATAASRSIPFGALATLLPEDVNALHPALVLGAIVRRQRGLGGARPTLVVVDDAHLLDDHSAVALLGLVTSGAGRVLATVRTGEIAPDAVRALWKDSFVAAFDLEPFDRAATRRFLAARLGGEVSATAADLLWRHTRGNALFLSELARQARLDGRLIDEHGVWMWRGDMTIPARLADLLDQRFDGLDDAGLDALGALVLGEPLPLATLSAVAAPAGIAELEVRRIIDAETRDATTWYRFAHPMLGAAAARRITPARRRRLADALVTTPAANVDLLRRAMWQLDSTATPDVDLLLAAGGAVFLTQPELALRLAEHALPHAPGPRAALMMADARAELGDVAGARAAQAVALGRVRDEADLLVVRINDVSLTAFTDRRPDRALELLTAATAEVSPVHWAELESMAAQITVFSTRPADALRIAERVLASDPPRACAIRAEATRVMALALVDRTVEALSAAEALLVEVAAGPASPYAQGIAHVAAFLVRFVAWDVGTAPASEVGGRWPVPPVLSTPAADAAPAPSGAVSFPLFEGGRRLIAGHAELAVAPLTEAVAQQRSGEGLLRSEAVALLAVALAATGRPQDAARLLDEAPPDRVALYAGLGPWAASAVAAAQGDPAAVGLAFEAFHEALEAGSPISAIAYLDAASQYGAARQAAEALEAWGHDVQAPLSVARAAAIRARAGGDGAALLDAAERLAALGVVGVAFGARTRVVSQWRSATEYDTAKA
ncbi:MAG: AAA family ATPase, partial [Ilumatobacteraceae bacterium]